ncbi:hypothetical protein [Thiocapsa sp. N5-Cardenillas]|uniref:hypothetical protein n=1 Tax=Thiocapsa sp. N5-Cardenillas TaxID=3137397 RepID=UPI0035AFC91B
MEAFGIEPSAVKLSDRMFAPLFYVTQTGGTAATWDYLNKSADDQRHCRETILNLCHGGETPAIVFLLTPPYEAGNIFTPFPNVINPANLDKAVDAILECLWDGIAVIPCLYTDDKMPWWYEIEKHTETWNCISDRISGYCSGICLSIESNEQTTGVGMLQHKIMQAKVCFDGLPVGTHLCWKGAGKSGYRWQDTASTPSNADFILVEFSWHPKDGDKKGVSAVQSEMLMIQAALPGRKLLFHEYNMNPGGEIMGAQRELLRSYKPWGVG